MCSKKASQKKTLCGRKTNENPNLISLSELALYSRLYSGNLTFVSPFLC